jgi:predicted nucleic acid-binding protein
VTIGDTSILIDCFTGPRRHAPALYRAIESGEVILIPSLVLYEWLRGPRVPGELKEQEAVFPSGRAIPFGPEEAAISARLYRSVVQPRGREIDLGIAAYAIARDAKLWTLNRDDFKDIPGLQLASF